MKKIIIAFLSIALVISLSFNIILIRKSKININYYTLKEKARKP